jgi:DNA-binding SARP family transcriptional activator
MTKHTVTILLFLLAFVKYTYTQDYLDEGLYFSSHEVTQEQRTSLNLTPKNSFHFKDKFIIEFEANFREGDGHYGNIVKIIGDEHLNIDLVANLVAANDNFWLTVKDQLLFKYKWSDIPKGGYNKWIKFNIEIDIKNSKIAISINGDKVVKSAIEIEDISDFDIIFGKKISKKFSITDVCPMSVRNIKILDKNGILVRNWVLGKHTTNNKIYDSVINDEATVENPKWLIDQHVFWKKNKDFVFNNLVGSAKDIDNERIFFIESKTVHVYSTTNDSMESFPFKEGSLKCQSNAFVYNNFKNELIAYSINENNYRTFNFETLEWSNSDVVCDETEYLHHNKMISPKDSTLLTFGGYGLYTYKSVFKKIDQNTSKFLSFDTKKQITPRYLSSSGILNSNEFLIFGGYGSSSGKQGVNGQFYYDLYSVDFEGLKVTKLWETENLPPTPFVPVQSMVIDNNSNSFYTLIYNNTTYNTNLKLARFGIDTYEKSVFTDSIPYKFLDIKSNTDFFINSKKTKLYTLTSSENKVSLHSLAYPPLVSSDVYQDEIIKNTTFNYYWLLALLTGVLAFFLFFKFRKKEKPHVSIEESNEEILQLTHVKLEKIKKSAIYLFGGFQVYDSEGHDITALFTPTIKELFLLILLSSKKTDQGISSKKLTELLWPNKSESNARNNRNVNISKLRLLLHKIGNIDISNENTYWQMNIGDTVFCDYSFVINKLSKNIHENIKKEEIYDLLNIVSRGEISPDIQTEWIEDFKADIANLLIDDLYRISKTQDDLHLLILISNAILKYGTLNEEAISLKCKSLYAIGKKGSAKQSYIQFCKAYLDLLDSEYDKTFKEIIS